MMDTNERLTVCPACNAQDAALTRCPHDGRMQCSGCGQAAFTVFCSYVADGVYCPDCSHRDAILDDATPAASWQRQPTTETETDQ